MENSFQIINFMYEKGKKKKTVGKCFHFHTNKTLSQELRLPGIIFQGLGRGFCVHNRNGVYSLKDTWLIQVFVINETEVESDQILCHIHLYNMHNKAHSHGRFFFCFFIFRCHFRAHLSTYCIVIGFRLNYLFCMLQLFPFAAVIAIEKHS